MKLKRNLIDLDGRIVLGTKKSKRLIEVWKDSLNDDKEFDAEYWGRLIEKAPEMEENLKNFIHFIEIDNSGGCGEFTYDRHTGTYKKAVEILDYLKPKEEEMVTLKMSRKSAEAANFMKFEVK